MYWDCQEKLRYNHIFHFFLKLKEAHIYFLMSQHKWMSVFDNNPQRRQSACQQEDNTDEQSWASVTVVTIATCDVALERTWSNSGLAGKVRVRSTRRLGGAILSERLEAAGPEIHLTTPIKTRRTLVAFHRTVWPWFGWAAYIAV